MSVATILAELEKLGCDNDRIQNDKSKRYLNITHDTGVFLAWLVNAVQAKTVLEVGTSNGYSTLWLASSVTQTAGHVYTIERDRTKAKEAAANFDRAGLQSRITLLVDEAFSALSRVPAPVDLIFLDADRSAYLDMAPRLYELLKAGGVLVCDNALSHADELADFVNWVQSQAQLSSCLIPVGKGELLIYKAPADPDRHDYAASASKS
ncbi:O-methyltransferase [Motiliproteus sediminis]|uniref:O-methyltransferase n=1 Tax=Motiliproteus sediminis TaxID=1468178 RepID=UPI001AEFC39C|nr:class I SAM-dependent methyltransferase [Motiliproteus sediminis]